MAVYGKIKAKHKSQKYKPRVDDITDVLFCGCWCCCSGGNCSGGNCGVNGGSGGGVDDGVEFVSLISLVSILTMGDDSFLQLSR